MLPAATFAYFLIRLFGVSTALWYLTSKFLSPSLPDIVASHLWGLSLSITFAVFYIYAWYIYPRFFSPFRHLPILSVPKGGDLNLITEMPRGSTPLKGATANPDADILFVEGVWFSPDTILPISPAALRDLMSTNTYDFIKPSGIRHFLASVIGYGLITTEGNVHKRQRKALVPAFNVKHIRGLYPTMWEQTGILLQEMQKDNDKRGNVEVSEWASRLALDIIGRSALSRNFQSLTTSEHPVAKSFSAILEPEPHMIAFLGLNLAFPVWFTRLLPLKANRIVRRESKYLREFCTELLVDQQRVLMAESRAEKHRDDVEDHSILRNIIESGEFDNDELIDQMLTFIAAGHETTGSSISWAMHLLTLPENRHYQQKIRDEIRDAFRAKDHEASFNTHDTPQWSEFESLPYLNGLCEEILRLFPAVPTTIRESIRWTSMAGVSIPPDTLILVCPWAVNRNPNYWGADAGELRPERWIDTQPNGSLHANKHGGATSNYCEITFLHGPRACIGRDFAKAELRCVLAGILGRFEVSRLKGDNGHVDITGAVTTKPRGGLKINLRRVDGW